MVDVLNACGVDYVCLGNHETDIPHRDMLERIVESDFVWVRGEGGGGVETDGQGGGGSRGGKERRKRRREKGRILVAGEEGKEKSSLFAAPSTSLASSLLPQINSSIPSLPLLDVPLEPRKIPEYALLEVGGIEVALLGNAEGKDVSVGQRKIEGERRCPGSEELRGGVGRRGEESRPRDPPRRLPADRKTSRILLAKLSEPRRPLYRFLSLLPALPIPLRPAH
jgi:hypothetical protein